MGQGGWSCSGLGGGQPERAAASALGNIVYSWLVAQDMHPAWAPPPAKDSRPVPKPGIPGERIRRKGSPASAPEPGSLLQTRILPPLGLSLLLALASPVSETAHICWPNPKKLGRGRWRPRFCERTRTFAPSQRPPRSWNLLFLWQHREGGGAGRRMGVG